MKKVIGLIGPDGKNYKTELRTDQKTQDLMNYITNGLEYLSARGLLVNYENPETTILTGSLPTTKNTPTGHIYSAFRDKIDGKDTIVIDERLNKEEKLYQMTHEIMHGLFPNNSEHQIQVKTAKTLRNIANHYAIITSSANHGNFKAKNISPTMLSQKDFEEAYSKLVKNGAYGLKSGDLEGKVIMALSIGTMILSAIMISSSLTGFAISNVSGGIKGIMGLSFFVISLGLFSFYKKFRI